MAMKLLCTIFIFVMFLHFSPAENHPTHTHEVAPSPSPQSSNSTNNLPSYGYTPGSLQPQECGPRCSYRCSNTQYKKPCLFFCNKCCAKCLCVPTGTYGNKQSCPCYNNWKTKRGGPKCP
ncbi:protein GAST1-like [Chenopodium quinoa]|uniref:protein GAST1-like n=1 Tax=Chenopodium quinoa TaxID=63459 RepID=UPI000B7783D3|nr:protein GAST1-like [Chenopodium quinoa]